ncbi:apolipoprotein N-acyltransferase [Deinococcus metalli]|uniref:Apolipoprotein N-acyltransferase n=1 Tax=Deinococcus metalli TaxID=1141878 RepID=A0A7W8KDS9_9DEIO|nr:hypothetical protein [Deinococcus metalli]MBB5376322.1 apolipoprotein N-acyltransferase [Deinococcus metalli]GHF39156.1 hypothetical protein GCM10017781_14590 [Deinococcus metalli]
MGHPALAAGVQLLVMVAVFLLVGERRFASVYGSLLGTGLALFGAWWVAVNWRRFRAHRLRVGWAVVAVLASGTGLTCFGLFLLWRALSGQLR